MPGEVGPVGVVPETQPEVDLLGALHDTVITINGVTDTAGNLAKLCPINLTDPANRDAANRYMVKAINASGAEIDPEYEPEVSKLTEQMGLDKNYTVAERRKVDTGKEETDAPDQTESKLIPLEKTKTEETAPLQDTTHNKRNSSLDRVEAQRQLNSTAALREIVAGHATQASEIHSRTHFELDLPKIKPPQHPSLTELPNPEKPVTLPLDRVEAKRKVLSNAEHFLEETPPALNVQHKLYINDTVPLLHKLNEASTLLESETQDSTTEFPMLTPAEEKDNVKLPFIETPAVNPDLLDEDRAIDLNSEASREFNQTEEEALINVWEAELAKEPRAIYEDFTDSLAVFISSFDITHQEESGDAVDTALPLGKIDVMEECPAIVVEVFDRLQEVEDDEKVLVGEALKEISGAVHGLHILEALSAPEEIKAEVEQQLEALCASLFDRLGIEYDEVAVRQFAMVMRHKAFSPALHQQTGEIELYLENIGTHEAKYFRREVRNDITQVSRHLIQALGTFVLAYAHSSAAA